MGFCRTEGDSLGAAVGQGSAWAVMLSRRVGWHKAADGQHMARASPYGRMCIGRCLRPPTPLAPAGGLEALLCRAFSR